MKTIYEAEYQGTVARRTSPRVYTHVAFGRSNPEWLRQMAEGSERQAAKYRDAEYCQREQADSDRKFGVGKLVHDWAQYLSGAEHSVKMYRERYAAALIAPKSWVHLGFSGSEALAHRNADAHRAKGYLDVVVVPCRVVRTIVQRRSVSAPAAEAVAS